MLKNQLKRLPEEDFYIRYDLPQDLTGKIMNSVYSKMSRRELAWKAAAFSFAALFAVSLTLGGWLVSVRPQMKAVFVYPHSSNIQSVEVVGEFGKSGNRIPLELSEEDGVWTKEISIHKNEIPDYEIHVIEKSENAGVENNEEADQPVTEDLDSKSL